jgi:uncharacterized protein YndB with AHSA1/START domain
MAESQETQFQAKPLGELQWWSMEVIGGTIIALGIGIAAGSADLSLVQTFMVGGLALLAIYIIGALLRRVGHSQSLQINAPVQNVFEALLANAGKGPIFHSLWGIALDVEREPQFLKAGSTIEAPYSFNGKPGSLQVTVTEIEQNSRLVQKVSNRFRGRTTNAVSETTLEPIDGGTRLTERSNLVLPLSAGHLIAAIYSRMVLARSTKNFLHRVKRAAESPS